MCLFFVWLQWLLSYQQFCDFSLNLSNKTYPGLMLPPDNRNWQLIDPNFESCFLVLGPFVNLSFHQLLKRQPKLLYLTTG
jgi:hypothetical protein